MSEKTNELVGFLRKLNLAWMNGRFDELRTMLHEDMVIVAPDFQVPASGREACAKSYADFTAQAEVKELRESEFWTRSWGDAAIVSYRFDLTYAMDGKEHTDSGRDLFLLVRKGDGWQAAWRTLLPAG